MIIYKDLFIFDKEISIILLDEIQAFIIKDTNNLNLNNLLEDSNIISTLNNEFTSKINIIKYVNIVDNKHKSSNNLDNYLFNVSPNKKINKFHKIKDQILKNPVRYLLSLNKDSIIKININNKINKLFKLVYFLLKEYVKSKSSIEFCSDDIAFSIILVSKRILNCYVGDSFFCRLNDNNISNNQHSSLNTNYCNFNNNKNNNNNNYNNSNSNLNYNKKSLSENIKIINNSNNSTTTNYYLFDSKRIYEDIFNVHINNNCVSSIDNFYNLNIIKFNWL